MLTEQRSEDYIVLTQEAESRGDKLELRGNGSVIELNDRGWVHGSNARRSHVCILETKLARGGIQGRDENLDPAKLE